MDKIKRISQRDIIKGARHRWLDEYKHYPNHLRVGWGKRETPEKIKDALAKLDLDTCSEADIDAALGFKNWAALRCHLCLKNVPEVVRLGDETDRPRDVCSNCLHQALKVLDRAKRSTPSPAAVAHSASGVAR